MDADYCFIVHVVSAPVVSVAVSSGALMAGGVRNTTLNCSTMLDQAVLDGGLIYYDFIWWDRDGNTITSGGRITIVPTYPSLSSIPYSTLTLSPLSTEDTNFTCGVIAQQNRMVASELAMASIPLNVVSESAVNQT